MRTHENSGELWRGLMRTQAGTQGAQTTHFGELSEELRRGHPSVQILFAIHVCVLILIMLSGIYIEYRLE